MPTPDVVTRRAAGRSWLRLLAGVLSGLLWLAGGLPGASNPAWADTDRETANWEKLKSMTATEREQIQRNLKRFRGLSEDKKWALRKLRTDLREDQARDGQLNRVMDNYFEWLKTLTPGQRSDLAEQPDSTRRRKLVADLMARQQRSTDTGTPRRRRSPLEPAVLEKFFDLLGTELQAKGYVSEADLSSRTGMPRYFYILRRGFSGTFPPDWLSPEFGEKLLTALPDPAQRAVLRDPDPRVRLSRMLGMIAVSLQSAVREQEDQIPGEELEKFFIEMTGEQQDEVMRRPYSEQDRRLRQLYMRAQGRDQTMAGNLPPIMMQFLKGQLARSQGLFGAGRPGGPGPGGGPPGREGTPVRATPGRGTGLDDEFERRRPGPPVGGGGPGGGPGPGPGRGRPKPPRPPAAPPPADG